MILTFNIPSRPLHLISVGHIFFVKNFVYRISFLELTIRCFNLADHSDTDALNNPKALDNNNQLNYAKYYLFFG